MADKLFTRIQMPNEDQAWYKYGIYPVKGTQTANTNFWTGVIDLYQIYDGLTIAYFLPRNGTSGTAYLNLTLKDGSTTRYIPVYMTGTTKLTNQYAAGSTIVLTYWSAGSISIDGTVTKDSRWLRADYSSDSDTWRNVSVNEVTRLGTEITSGALNLVEGKNITIDGTGDNVKINMSESIVLSQAEYDQLGESIYNDKNYYVYDAQDGRDPSGEEPIIYGYHVDPNESDPAAAVTYLEDAIGMTPAAMGNTVFNYGSWGNAFFMPRPCMVKFDGTVDYYLDPNDYSKKEDGTSSDVSNLSYQGNAMMEWPLIWWKYEAGAIDGEGYFYCSNKRVDDSYHCWCNYDANNNINKHFYTAIYNGCIYNGKMRSISGLQLFDKVSTTYSSSKTYSVGTQIFKDGKQYKCITAISTPEAWTEAHWEQVAYCGNTTGQQEVDAAVANNTTNNVEWYTDVFADRMLINGLLFLIGKSLNCQAVFGNGIQAQNQAFKNNYITGAGDNSGLFYGSKSDNITFIKTFGMENWWGLVWHRTAGLIGATTGYLYKLTYGMIDGSTGNGYNSSGSGYKTSIISRPAGGYLKTAKYGEFGYLPSAVGGSTTTYYSDYHYNGNYFAVFGGGALNTPGEVGPSFLALSYAFLYATWPIAAALSLKPLVK